MSTEPAGDGPGTHSAELLTETYAVACRTSTESYEPTPNKRAFATRCVDRDWFRHQTAGALDFERCVLHITARARRYIARECKKQARTASRLDEERETDPTNYTPEETVAGEDITHLVRQIRASMPVEPRAECDLLLGTLTQGEVAARLGVSQQAVSERVARLKAKVKALAIDAGILGSGGYYDTQA